MGTGDPNAGGHACTELPSLALVPMISKQARASVVMSIEQAC